MVAGVLGDLKQLAVNHVELEGFSLTHALATTQHLVMAGSLALEAILKLYLVASIHLVLV